MASVTQTRTGPLKGGMSAFNFPVERLTENILALSDAAVVVTHDKSVEYCTKSIVSVLGINNESVIEHGWARLLELIHPADSRVLQKKILPEIRHYFKSLPINEKTHHTFNYTLRMRTDDGNYSFIAFENRPLIWTGINWPTTYVTVLRDISLFGNKGEVMLSIYQHNENKSYKKVYQKNYCVPSGNFSSRETEIVRYIAKGMTSHQIAHELSISYETVRNHRKKIMRKAACNSSSGLARLALENGII